jgi:hypothetical protein
MVRAYDFSRRCSTFRRSESIKEIVEEAAPDTRKAGPLAEPGSQFDFYPAGYFAAFTLRVRRAF